MSSNPQVVITGATGLIAKHTIAELLKRGHPVLGTVRNMNRTDDVRRAVSRAGADPASLNFARADLLSDDDWDVALEGAEVVLHMASPFPIAQPDDPDDVIRPARDGTLRVLKAATRVESEARRPHVVERCNLLRQRITRRAHLFGSRFHR